MTKSKEGEDDIDKVLRIPIMKFSYVDLQVATEDFKEELGSGGFGSVINGVMADSTMIAVKQLDNRGQGMTAFLVEIDTIRRLHHFNLVRLIRFCA
ncbi:hypothetical protein PRUPE_3G112900 [Prunus persica]|uniref:Protein kinase domain-containing protein n=1 Tax=Prunus persica TaxID=3760 RepID=A0A251PYK5_PRUPE|nr:hypothetical protein PRUPE_3G112900 [Prunus persica]